MNFDLQLAPTFDMSVRMNMRENNNENLWSYTFSEMAYRGIPWDNPFDENGNPVNIAATPPAEQTWYYANRQNPWHGQQYNYDRSGGIKYGICMKRVFLLQNSEKQTIICVLLRMSVFFLCLPGKVSSLLG